MTPWMRGKNGETHPVTLEEHYQRAADLDVYGDSGICRHLPYLRSLVQPGDVVVELGTGGADQSTLAWLSAVPRSLYCYDLNVPDSVGELEALAKENGVHFSFQQGDTTKGGAVPAQCDILFVDTLHNYETVKAELTLFAWICRRQIVFHDVVAFGRNGQFTGADQGINLAIAEFLFEHTEWRVERYSTEDNGLLTLRRHDLTGMASAHGVPLAGDENRESLLCVNPRLEGADMPEEIQAFYSSLLWHAFLLPVSSDSEMDDEDNQENQEYLSKIGMGTALRLKSGEIVLTGNLVCMHSGFDYGNDEYTSFTDWGDVIEYAQAVPPVYSKEVA